MKRLATLTLAIAMAAPVYAQNLATVNGKAIPQKQFDELVALLVERGEADTPELRERVKQEMINGAVFVQAAEKAGLDKKADVRQELELARQSILAHALMSDYLEKNPVTDAQVQARYDEIKGAQADRQEYKLRHILVKDEAEAKKLIADIKGKKTTFEAAAKKSSIDPGSGQNGGDLGWGPVTNYVPEFAAAAEKLKKGEMTQEPVQSQFGWHVIEVEDTRALQFPALDSVRPQIEDMLRQQSLAKMRDDLMKSATIK
ncbi:peptidylprolyl isomerase [Pusillimonas sp. CC-YST705]|uniref:peptidylprolyl isomerase n=1 Tax=Mesopusillimonas faecipullorum TaxID=2755040 RepID=A0ABS8C8W6_9BURK|nr:peptidylprolyl isomerase [Mesopusillimonas faecipullorum]MCB5362470.1 peptidylprolyl isomerase [Mesopusillimonas faecipullorum]